MTEWIEINLSYSSLPQEQETPAPESPNLETEELALFGTTANKCFELCNWVLRNKIWLEIHCGDEEPVENEDPAESDEPDEPDETDEELQAAENTLDAEVRRRFKEQDPESAKYDALYHKIRDWEDVHPANIAWGIASDKIREQDKLRTFQGRELAQPGVQIEIANGQRFLIGHINQLRGVCDDCTEFESTTVVKRYRVVVSPEDLA